MVASEDHRFLAADQLLEAGIEGATIVLEPLARNTAPAIALGALQALERDADALLLVLPADHLIGDTAAFVDAVTQALPLAEQGWLVTFGIRPDRAGNRLRLHPPRRSHRRARLPGASSSSRSPTWPPPSPILPMAATTGTPACSCSRHRATWKSWATHAPDMLAAVRAAHAKASADLDFVRIDRDAFALVPDNSIDYAVMEKTRRAAVIPVSCAWSDIGSWSALWLTGDKDAAGQPARRRHHGDRHAQLACCARTIATCSPPSASTT